MTTALVMVVWAVIMVAGTCGGQPTIDGPPTASTAADVRRVAEDLVNPTANTTHRTSDGSVGDLKKVMWKKCMTKNYVTCVKLALMHLVDRVERTNESYSLAPGVTVSSQSVEASGSGDATSTSGSVGRDSSEEFDRLFVDKLGRYFSTLTLNVKLLDDSTLQSVRKLGEAAADASVQSGRGKKQKYAQSILLAGWVTGAMLLALGMKAIAVLAGKALMTALMSLLLSALASFRGGHGHSEPKSTTYEIVTKPVYSHTHAAAEDAHASGTQNVPTYRRSIGGSLVPATSSSEEADHIVYRIHASDKTPIYIPIERRRRRRR